MLTQKKVRQSLLRLNEFKWGLEMPLFHLPILLGSGYNLRCLPKTCEIWQNDSRYAVSAWVFTELSAIASPQESEDGALGVILTDLPVG